MSFVLLYTRILIIIIMVKETYEIKKTIYLSDLLYDISEVKSSLLDCVIKKSSDKEIIFWVNELWVSGFKKLWSFAWKIFYDFYAFGNQSRINTLIKIQEQYNEVNQKYEKCKNTDVSIGKNYDMIKMKILCGVFIILKGFDPSCIVFLLRNTITNQNLLFEDISKYKKVYNKYDCKTDKEKLFVCSMDKRSYKSIRINDCLYSIKVSEKILKKYIKLYERFYNQSFIDNPYYKNKKHLLLFYLVVSRNNFYRMDGQINELLIKNEKAMEINDIVDNLRNKTHLSAFRYLKHNRLYEIHPMAGIQTSLSELSIEKKLNLLRDEWLLYIYNSPIWKKRIKHFKHRIIKTNNMYKIIFNDIDNEAMFYEKYGYDPDEQSLCVQMKSISDPKGSIKDWLICNFKKNKSYFNIRCSFNNIRY
jgi:hypothetical protein